MKKAAGLLAAMTMVLAACGGGASEESAGLGDSIGIEGHWTIDVLDPDGSLDQRVEFQNAILSGGWEKIGRLLAGEWGMETDWGISLNGTFCDQPNNFCGLAADSVAYDDTAQAVVVTGSILAPQDGDVDLVRSSNKVCRFDAQRGCVPDNFSNFFSFHNISPVVTVAGGQTIQIEIQFTLG